MCSFVVCVLVFLAVHADWPPFLLVGWVTCGLTGVTGRGSRTHGGMQAGHGREGKEEERREGADTGERRGRAAIRVQKEASSVAQEAQLQPTSRQGRSDKHAARRDGKRSKRMPHEAQPASTAMVSLSRPLLLVVSHRASAPHWRVRRALVPRSLDPCARGRQHRGAHTSAQPITTFISAGQCLLAAC
jgi:hypothetical protein